ncbi:unnamed protein product [Protopolystoma xenopodis]|uniref:Secreted protein n=1 Tax=Protopolystoma xenopodis TaxID=117903 RepID=A0A448XNU3_9PLAT|nr:unnamed protein product [Protopolystoma xenopodis]
MYFNFLQFHLFTYCQLFFTLHCQLIPNQIAPIEGIRGLADTRLVPPGCHLHSLYRPAVGLPTALMGAPFECIRGGAPSWSRSNALVGTAGIIATMRTKCLPV